MPIQPKASNNLPKLRTGPRDGGGAGAPHEAGAPLFRRLGKPGAAADDRGTSRASVPAWPPHVAESGERLFGCAQLLAKVAARKLV